MQLSQPVELSESDKARISIEPIDPERGPLSNTEELIVTMAELRGIKEQCNENRFSLVVARSMVESTARRVLTVGDQDVQVTLAAIKEFVRRMAKLPGQRTLILVSPGFVSIAPEALSLESQIMDLAVQSSVTINALDARGLYTGITGSSERGSDQSSIQPASPL